MITRIGLLVGGLALAIVLAGVPTAHAVDGQILINQARAMAGSVTPGDAAGFPVTINQPGSYRLSSNLILPDANTNAIEITASNVTLDLNGFAIVGATVCTGFPVSSCAPTGFGSGITTVDPLGLSGIAVHNGTVRGMGLRGIFLAGGGHLVERVRAESNGGPGILAHGTMSHNTATINGAQGISGTGTISHNTVTGNGAEGIFAQGAVSHNTVRNNGAGIAAFTGSIISYNTVVDNSGFGLVLELSAGYTGNVIRGNTAGTVSGSGVSLGGGNHNLCGGVLC